MSRYDYLCNSEINDRNNFAYFLQEPQQLLQQIIQVKGEDGKSAYEIAKELGFSGSEQQWLSSLKGANGKSAYQSAVDNGFEGTEAEWIDSMMNRSYSKDEINSLLSNFYNATDIDQLLKDKTINIVWSRQYRPPIFADDIYFKQGDIWIYYPDSSGTRIYMLLKNPSYNNSQQLYFYRWQSISDIKKYESFPPTERENLIQRENYQPEGNNAPLIRYGIDEPTYLIGDITNNIDWGMVNFSNDSQLFYLIDISISGIDYVTYTWVNIATSLSTYNKTEIDNKLSNIYDKSEINNIISSLENIGFLLVQRKPTYNIQSNKIYLVPSPNAGEENIYEEWIYINNNWELIGSVNEVNLNDYYTKIEIDNKISNNPKVFYKESQPPYCFIDQKDNEAPKFSQGDIWICKYGGYTSYFLQGYSKNSYDGVNQYRYYWKSLENRVQDSSNIISNQASLYSAGRIINDFSDLGKYYAMNYYPGDIIYYNKEKIFVLDSFYPNIAIIQQDSLNNSSYIITYTWKECGLARKAKIFQDQTQMPPWLIANPEHKNIQTLQQEIKENIPFVVGDIWIYNNKRFTLVSIDIQKINNYNYIILNWVQPNPNLSGGYYGGHVSLSSSEILSMDTYNAEQKVLIAYPRPAYLLGDSTIQAYYAEDAPYYLYICCKFNVSLHWSDSEKIYCQISWATLYTDNAGQSKILSGNSLPYSYLSTNHSEDWQYYRKGALYYNSNNNILYYLSQYSLINTFENEAKSLTWIALNNKVYYNPEISSWIDNNNGTYKMIERKNSIDNNKAILSSTYYKGDIIILPNGTYECIAVINDPNYTNGLTKENDMFIKIYNYTWKKLDVNYYTKTEIDNMISTPFIVILSQTQSGEYITNKTAKEIYDASKIGPIVFRTEGETGTLLFYYLQTINENTEVNPTTYHIQLFGIGAGIQHLSNTNVTTADEYFTLYLYN